MASQRKKPDPQSTFYTWEEIIEHDKKSSVWIVIKGKVYDLTNFIEKHPGGDIIMDGAGGDCTPMWESYHPLAIIKRGPIKKYFIGMVRDYHDFYSWDGKFYETVKERVEKAIPKELRRYDVRMYQKFFIIITAFVVTMYLYVTYCTWWSAIIFGIASS